MARSACTLLSVLVQLFVEERVAHCTPSTGVQGPMITIPTFSISTVPIEDLDFLVVFMQPNGLVGVWLRAAGKDVDYKVVRVRNAKGTFAIVAETSLVRKATTTESDCFRFGRLGHGDD